MNLLLLALSIPFPPGGDPPFDEITPEVKQSIDKGVEWLMKTQNKDGSWGISERDRGDFTCTAIACMALMAGGNNQRTGPDPSAVDAVRRGLDWLLDQARKNPGDIARGNTTLVQNKLGKDVHNFFAVVFLSQAYGMEELKVTPDEKEQIKTILTDLCAYISKEQEPDGSWSKESFGGLKGTCMAWMALRSAHSAGVTVEDASVQKIVEFVTKRYDKRTHMFDNQAGGWGGYQTLYASSSCLRVLYGMGQDTTTVDLHESYKAIYEFVSKGGLQGQFLTVEGEDYLAAWMITQAMLHDEAGDWKEWYSFIREKLMRHQNKGDGSWTGTACISGKTFSTCCALLALQTPYRQLPMQDL